MGMWVEVCGLRFDTDLRSGRSSSHNPQSTNHNSNLPATIERPEIEELGPGAGGDSWIVTVFDNAKNTWQEVIAILIVATGCTFDEAYMETWEIDHLGKSVVHHGEEDECARVAKTIAEIGIRVEVSAE